MSGRVSSLSAGQPWVLVAMVIVEEGLAMVLVAVAVWESEEEE